MTSINDSEAQNYGVEAILGHDARYDRADEFMEVVTGLWETWEDDAIIADREAGIFADPDKVHELHHKGEYFSSRGPLTVPRTRRADRYCCRPDPRVADVNSPPAGRISSSPVIRESRSPATTMPTRRPASPRPTAIPSR